MHRRLRRSPGWLSAAFLLVAACSGDDTKVTTGTGNAGTTTSTGMGSTSTGSGGSSSVTTTSGTGVGGAAGSGGSGGSTPGTAGGGGTSAGAGGAGGAGGAAGGSAGASGAGGSGGAGACNTSPGKAIQFASNGVDIISGDLGSDLPGGNVARTIEVWAKYTGATSWLPEQSILETGLAMGGMNRVLGIDNSGYTGTTAQFGPYTNGFSDNNAPNGVFVMNIPQIGWIHLSWSYSGPGGMLSFTVNGTQYPVTTTGGTPMMNFFPGIVTLGRSQTFGGAGWTGVLDELRIWSIARTPTEVNRDMKVVLKGTEPGLVAYYRFDEGSGTFTDDVGMKASHRLSTCSTLSNRCFMVVNTNPNVVNWVASDLPGPFTCAP